MFSFRIDDVVPGMDWKRFWDVLHMLEQYNVKPLLGVVPNNKDRSIEPCEPICDFWDVIRNLQKDGYPIAMHGYEHLYVTKEAGIFPIKNDSEFAGLSYEKQYEKIKKGKKILEGYGICTDIFMAPSHSFDLCTLESLSACDFRFVTDGFSKQLIEYPYGIYGIPVCNNIRRIKRLHKRWDAFSVVLHTNSITESLLQRYENICKSCVDSICSYSELLKLGKAGKRYRIEEKRELFCNKMLSCASMIKRRSTT